MMRRNPFTLFIHLALVIIVAGALCTCFGGIQGEVTIADSASVTSFTKTSGPGDGTFPFNVTLVRVDVTFYPGTTTPMDFNSTLRIDGREYEVSMNNPVVVDGWRFYQSGMSADSSTFSVSHDPWGIGLTYIGYILGTVGLMGFFFQKKTAWRLLLKKRTVAALLLSAFTSSADAAELPAMQRPLAADLGKVYVYWNDRICPMQTMARDVTVKLYGSDSYKGLTSEQVLSGWLFYFDEWFRDYAGYEPEISRTDFDKSRKKLLERKSLITLLGTGEAFRIYPYRTAGGYTEWLSLTGRRPAQMDLEQWVFMSKTLPTIKELLLSGRNIRADEELKVLIRNQKKYAGEEVLPSEKKLKAEVLYNRYARPLYLGLLVLLLSGFYLFAGLSGRCVKRLWRVSATVGLIVAVVLNLSAVGMIWWLGGHVPMSNGTEMMLFMSAVSLVTALAVRQFVVRGSLLLVSAMALMVAGMASRTPQIGSLMPVLASPLLALHVMVIMCAYVLFVLMAVLSVIALLTKKESLKTELCRLNRLILLPAVFLLAVGIMIGAVWANRSWGRYWGWDPKETCALVMLVVYSLPLHWASPRLSCFRRPRVLHVYLLVALATVLFTYFGANFLIPGLHSYA